MSKRTLSITVNNASQLPSVEKSRESDPFVKLTFRDKVKKTKVIENNANPCWNEKLVWELEKAIDQHSSVDFEVLDYEKLGRDRLLGSGSISLREVVRSQSGQVQANIAIHDSNKRQLDATVSFVVDYRDPTKKSSGGSDTTDNAMMDAESSDSEGVATDVENAIDEQNKAETDQKKKLRVSRPRTTLPNKAMDFQIRVKIYEARQLPGGGSLNTIVKVLLGKEQKATKVKKNSSQPNWNELFFFNINNTPQTLFDSMITFSVFNAKTLRADALIGSYNLDVGSVYEQPQHSYLSKWLLLTDPDDSMSGCKGYLKFSTIVLGPGDEPPIEKDQTTDVEDIELNLLSPAGAQLQPAMFWLKVYRGEDIPQMDSATFSGIKKILGSNEDAKQLVDPYLSFYFAGKKVKTKVIKECDHPEWEQELRLGIKFPSMCDRIKLVVKDWDQMSKDDTVGTTFIYLDSIQDRSQEEEGYLPTFGPCWINLYGSTREFTEMPDSFDDLNEGKGEGCAYRGRILVELGTVIGEMPEKHVLDVEPDDMYRLQPFLKRRRYVLHAAFLEATMVCENDNPIQFEISIGNYGNKLESNVPPQPSTTQPTNPVFDGMAYYFLPWQDAKPCLSVNCQWEDISFRLCTLNILHKMIDKLELELKDIYVARKLNVDEKKLARKVIDALEGLCQQCRQPLPEPQSGVHAQTQLDIELRDIRRKVLDDVQRQAFHLLQNVTEVEDAVNSMDNFLDKLRTLVDEPQNSMPDVVIWMISGTSRIAYHRIPANDVLYSENDMGKGRYCGIKQTIFLKFPGASLDEEKQMLIPAQMRVRVWLGLESESTEWHKIHTDAEVEVFAETYENQSYTLGSWSPTSMQRPPYSDVYGKYKLQKEKFYEPEGWKWQNDWFISPEISLNFDVDAYHTTFLEEIYENEIRVNDSWMSANTPWTDVRGDAMAHRDKVECPDEWKWDEQWHIDLNRAVDDEGFEYCVEPTQGGYGPVEKNYHVYRRRRWIRRRVRCLNEEEMEKQQLFGTVIEQSVNASKDLWEFARTFNSKFHSKERKIDMVKRRRWHRRLVDVTPGLPCFFLIDVTSDVAKPGTVPKLDEKGKAIDRNRKDVKITPRMFLKFKTPARYQLRAYIYQARGLLSADDDSFSDPFARIIFMNRSQSTEVIRKTICPTWDQTLIFDDIIIYDTPAELERNPPKICIEVFDYDSFGSPEFMGRTVVKPNVLLSPTDIRDPKLQWLELHRLHENDNCGELLASFELFAYGNGDIPFLPPKRGQLFSVPSGIRPVLQRTAIEILCWGVRNMKKYQLSNVNRPSVEFECGGNIITSGVIADVSKMPNFKEPTLFMDVMLPKEEIYTPPMNIRCRDNRQFGRKPMVGMCSIKSLAPFRCEMDTDEEDIEIDEQQLKKEISIPIEGMYASIRRSKKKKKGRDTDSTVLSFEEYNEDNIDWWCKFYASIEEEQKSGDYLEKNLDTITVYSHELEKVKGYSEFHDFIHSIPLERGKAMDDDDLDIVGEFKGSFRIYSLPSDPSAELPSRVFSSIPSTENIEVLVRVYIVRAIDLQPQDEGGAADPYINIKCGKYKYSDVENYHPNTLNPLFGRLFEFSTVLPLYKDLRVQLYDYDLLSSDDLIGETRIDLENRYLTQYRATCGIAKSYNTSGINEWRDSMTPKAILIQACQDRNIPEPKFIREDFVKVGNKTFNLEEIEEDIPVNPHWGEPEQRLALHVLHHDKRFTLVPEHVETRPLYDVSSDFEQGKLQMWVDMFPKNSGPPGPPFEIKPRVPQKFQLRIVIWNTMDVLLVDDSFTGEEMVDIYVKGWLDGQSDHQQTDVHYRSLDGEGNFNWRFVFDLDYLPQEKMMVVQEKDHFWSLDKTETRLPAKLMIQIWDNDLFSSDDYIGEICLPIEKMIAPAKTAKACKPERVYNEKTGEYKIRTMQHINLFQQRRSRGWWACTGEDENGKSILAGKVEMEIELISTEEAEDKPCGKAREEPNANPTLEAPNRPDTSFLWFMSPWKTLKFIIWKNYKWKILFLILFILFVYFAILFIYTLPGAITMKMVGL